MKMRAGLLARWESSVPAVTRQLILAMNVFRGQEVTQENIIRARAIFWLEKIQCWRWHALLKR
jgi:hypothetical protein